MAFIQQRSAEHKRRHKQCLHHQDYDGHSTAPVTHRVSEQHRCTGVMATRHFTQPSTPNTTAVSGDCYFYEGDNNDDGSQISTASGDT